MKHDDAVSLISGVRIGRPTGETWADLGCGAGTFTVALATLLPGGSVIHAMDREVSVLRRVPRAYAGSTIITHIGDFRTQPWPFGELDGVILANSLHYVRDQRTFIGMCEPAMRHPRRFVIVEYDTDKANRWVPHPVSWKALESLFNSAGYSSITFLGSRPSMYRRASIYAALIEPSQGVSLNRTPIT